MDSRRGSGRVQDGLEEEDMIVTSNNDDVLSMNKTSRVWCCAVVRPAGGPVAHTAVGRGRAQHV
jgi:hypothetical protein